MFFFFVELQFVASVLLDLLAASNFLLLTLYFYVLIKEALYNPNTEPGNVPRNV